MSGSGNYKGACKNMEVRLQLSLRRGAQSNWCSFGYSAAGLLHPKHRGF